MEYKLPLSTMAVFILSLSAGDPSLISTGFPTSLFEASLLKPS